MERNHDESNWNRRQFLGRTLAGAGIASAPLAAQDVGMGERKGSAKRFESPYTLDIETPHVKWAKPLAGAPLRVLAVPTVNEGRTVIELAQRLSLDLTTVSIDPAWDTNKWTMCFGSDYGARAEQGNLSLIYSYLEQELTSAKTFDAIIMPLNHGWKQLTEASRAALEKRVKDGAGLVLVRPFTCPFSPLESTGTEQDIDEYPGNRSTPANMESSPWRRKGDHYITRAIPVESFPFRYIEHQKCRAATGAEILIEAENGTPVLAARTHGGGRVVGFGYRSAGLSWYMPMTARNDFIDVYWEYYYAMLCRALIYAAKREPSGAVEWDGPAVNWRMRDLHSQVVASGKGAVRKPAKLVPGRYFVEQQAVSDFRVTADDVPQTDSITELKATPAVIHEADTVEVQWKSARAAKIELIDALGRVIASGTGTGEVRLKAGRPLVHTGWVRATVGSAVEQIPVQFASSSRAWTDYEVMLPWAGPRSYQPWIPALDEQFRRIGVTTLPSPQRNFKFMVSSHLSAFGIYWYRRDNYLKRKKAFAETGDKKYLTREITLQSPAFEASVKKQFDARMRESAALNPLAYYLADESSLTCYTDAFDVDWAPEALAGFREWLRKEYDGLERLNSTWNTSFANWDAVVPMTAEEAQKHGNFAPWSDHRVYMEQVFVKAFAQTREWLREIDPQARPSISGTQVPTAHNGCNWYAIDQEVEYIQPYSGGSQDAMHYLFNPKLLITGFTGYGMVGEGAKYQQWQRLFYGHTGASIFWHYTLLNPDLAFSEQGQALAEAFGRLQSGIGRVFMNSRLREDGVAIHFSMNSIRGAWITDGKITADMGNVNRTSPAFADLAKRRDAWVKELETRGLQFRFLATPQIETGALKDYKVLILPYSIALSDREAREIEAFMERGGVVYADEQMGKMDERCRFRKEPLWAGERKGLVRRGPGDVGIQPAVPVEGKFLRTIRDFGGSRLIGLLPEAKTTVAVPQLKGVVYDLLHGGVAPRSLEASQGMPVLLLERPTRIARLQMDASYGLRLTDEAGAPVDRSVVRVEVFDPKGRMVRWYCSNADIVNGEGRAQIPFALSDRGLWRVRARDVVSGLKAERQVRL